MPKRSQVWWSFALVALVGGCYPQSEECAQYVECQVHYEETLSLPEVQTNRFKPDGVCWESESLAQDCTDECVTRITTRVIDLEEAEEDLGPCGP